MSRACALLWVCGKNHNKKKKTIWRKIVAIHNVFKEKTTKLNLNQLNIKKIKSTKIIFKKIIRKKKRNEKKSCRETL
jgi:hypothetical protein